MDLDGRPVDRIDARAAQQAGVVRRVSGVASEILTWPELDWVHEDADDHNVVFDSRRLDQAEMPGMERPHRRHEPDFEALSAPPPRRGEHRGGSFENGERTIRRRT